MSDSKMPANSGHESNPNRFASELEKAEATKKLMDLQTKILIEHPKPGFDFHGRWADESTGEMVRISVYHDGARPENFMESANVMDITYFLAPRPLAEKPGIFTRREVTLTLLNSADLIEEGGELTATDELKLQDAEGRYIKTDSQQRATDVLHDHLVAGSSSILSPDLTHLSEQEEMLGESEVTLEHCHLLDEAIRVVETGIQKSVA